jgi:hypothetical protein
MFEFYLTIMDSLAYSQNPAFLVKFNKLVYADEKLTADEKFYLLGEMQKRSQKVAPKPEKADTKVLF